MNTNTSRVNVFWEICAYTYHVWPQIQRKALNALNVSIVEYLDVEIPDCGKFKSQRVNYINISNGIVKINEIPSIIIFAIFNISRAD